MPRIRDILQRFRPISAPGSASAGGVPAEPAADLAAELRPLLDSLEVTRAECRAVVDDATAAAEQTRAKALAEAGRIRASVPDRAAVERAEAANRLAQRQARRSRGGGSDCPCRGRRRDRACTCPDPGLRRVAHGCLWASMSAGWVAAACALGR